MRFTKRISMVVVGIACGVFTGAASSQEGSPNNVLDSTGRDAAGAIHIQSITQIGNQAQAIKRNLQHVKLPPGFKIELYAIVPDARQMAVGPSTGIVMVGTRRKKIWVVSDKTQSGVADDVRHFAPSVDLKLPNGVCFSADGTLYSVELNRVLAYAKADSYTRNPAIAPRIVVPQGQLVPVAEESVNHGARTCRIGPDKKLYITLGNPYNVPPSDKIELYDKVGMMGIIRMNTDGTHREVFARGIRNSVGMDFNPQDGTLWFTDNQVDGMGDDIPPGELNRATRAGQDFGFPYYGGGHTRTVEYKKDTAPADAVFPQVEMAAHAADLGMVFYNAHMFPKKYQGGIFSAQHGSWNRTTPVGARIMFTSLKKDGTAAQTEVFAQGWLTSDNEYLGRPVDVAVLPDGSLLVSDDEAGAIYRISYFG